MARGQQDTTGLPVSADLVKDPNVVKVVDHETDPNAVHDDDSPVYVGDEETAAAEAVAELAAPSGFNHMNHQHRQHYAHNGDGGVAHVAHPTSAM